MGNSASTTARPHTRTASPSPPSNHGALRTKKKSLELPDLASLSLSSQRNRAAHEPPKSASIPIPYGPQPSIIPGEAGRTRHPPAQPSNSDLLLSEHARGRTSTHNFRRTSRGYAGPPTYNGHPPPYSRQHSVTQAQAQAHQRIQEIYNQANVPHVPPSPATSPSDPERSFVQETVQSSAPVLLDQIVAARVSAAESGAGPATNEDGIVAELVPVKITWRGGGRIVTLARAGDDDWKGRQPMERESPTSNVWHTSVSLPPGTHHIRFVVDDQWRVADDLPTAVDDQGSLANYVAVPITYSAAGILPSSPPSMAAPSQPRPVQQPPALQTPPPLHSSTPTASAPPPRKLQPGNSFWSATSSTDDESQDGPDYHHGHHHHPHHGAHHAQHSISSGGWTNVLPPELIEAAREEETYLAASAGQFDRPSGTMHVSGFVPAPNIPPAPGLPRHLDKLILNTRMNVGPVVSSSASATGSSSAGGEKSRRERGGKGREGRRDRDRDRDREGRREKERERKSASASGAASLGISSSTPPVPAAEEAAGDVEVVVTNAEARPANGAAFEGEAVATEKDPGAAAPTSDPPSTSETPNASTPTTPDLSKTAPPSGSASGTGTPASSGSTSTTATPAIAPSPNRPLALGLDNSPALADDASVLPVPSHVVLHHLSTSAIRNGVLAVANTTRYKKKYLTTVYYKPT